MMEPPPLDALFGFGGENNRGEDKKVQEPNLGKGKETVDVCQNRKVSEKDEEAFKAAEKVKQEDPESTLYDQMIAASSAAMKVKQVQKKKEMVEMNKTFGSTLEKAFKEKAKKKKEEEVVVNAYKEQGNECLKMGKLKEACSFYSKAIKLDKENEILYSNRSYAYLKQGDASKALEDANKCLQLNHKFKKGLLRKAGALLALGKNDEAAKWYEKCIGTAENSKEKKSLEVLYQKALPNYYSRWAQPVIKPKSNTNPLEIPEVQKAMSESEQEKMMKTLRGGEWNNDEFMKNVSSNPILSQAIKDPRFAMIAQGLQTNPTATMKQIENDPGMKQVVNELIKVLGGHFMKLGEMQNNGDIPQQSQQDQPIIISSEEAKLQREADEVLKNDQIREILSNPETRDVLNKCSNPTMFRKYMNDPIWGARIRLLQQHGLVQLQN